MHTTDLSLHDEISAPWHVAITFEVDSGSFADDTRELATNIIVTQSGRYEVRRQVSQSNDEVVRKITLKRKNIRLGYAQEGLLYRHRKISEKSLYQNYYICG